MSEGTCRECGGRLSKWDEKGFEGFKWCINKECSEYHKKIFEVKN